MKEHIGGFFVSKQSKLRLWKLEIERFSPKVCIAGHCYVNTKWETLKKGFLDAQSVKITFIRALGLVFLFNGKKP